MTPILTIEQVRRLDRLAEKDYKIPALLLMENAGRGVADFAEKILQGDPQKGGVWIVAGTGNNGGDGLVAARHLFQRKVPVQIFILGDPAKFTGDAALNYRITQKLKIKTGDFSAFKSLSAQASEFKKLIIVDAILGTGFSGALRSPAAEAIRTINELKKSRPEIVHVVAVDIPSGLSGDDGPAGGEAVKADSTVTFACLKSGLVKPESGPFVGKIEVMDIGIPEELIQSMA